MDTQEEIKKNLTEYELRRIYEMNDDTNLYQNLVSSLFPSIHGEWVWHFWHCMGVCHVV